MYNCRGQSLISEMKAKPCFGMCTLQWHLCAAFVLLPAVCLSCRWNTTWMWKTDVFKMTGVALSRICCQKASQLTKKPEPELSVRAEISSFWAVQRAYGICRMLYLWYARLYIQSSHLNQILEHRLGQSSNRSESGQLALAFKTLDFIDRWSFGTSCRAKFEELGFTLFRRGPERISRVHQMSPCLKKELKMNTCPHCFFFQHVGAGSWALPGVFAACVCYCMLLHFDREHVFTLRCLKQVTIVFANRALPFCPL